MASNKQFFFNFHIKFAYFLQYIYNKNIEPVENIFLTNNHYKVVCATIKVHTLNLFVGSVFLFSWQAIKIFNFNKLCNFIILCFKSQKIITEKYISIYNILDITFIKKKKHQKHLV